MKKREVAGIIAIPVAVGALLFGMSVAIPQAAPEPTATPSVARLLSDEAERAAPTATPTPEPAPAEPAPAPEPAPDPDSDPAPPPPPPPPVLCPPGSTANSNDGYNDTSCFPDICFTIPVPDPAHPECDVAFRP